MAGARCRWCACPRSRRRPKRRPPEPATPAEPEETSLLISEPVRSGQSILFPKGDVTVVGSVASGAEIVAGGSIHVYGALRGRAIAGFTGNSAGPHLLPHAAMPSCVAIDGLYETADEIDAALRGRAVQVWLAGEQVNIAALD